MFTPVYWGMGRSSGGTKAADQIQQSASLFTQSGVSVDSGEDPSRALRAGPISFFTSGWSVGLSTA